MFIDNVPERVTPGSARNRCPRSRAKLRVKSLWEFNIERVPTLAHQKDYCFQSCCSFAGISSQQLPRINPENYRVKAIKGNLLN